MTLANDLRRISTELLRVAQSVEGDDHKDLETVYGYYYSKGALDYRDKLLEAVGALPKDYSASEAFQVLLATFPDRYPGPSS